MLHEGLLSFRDELRNVEWKPNGTTNKRGKIQINLNQNCRVNQSLKMSLQASAAYLREYLCIARKHVINGIKYHQKLYGYVNLLSATKRCK